MTQALRLPTALPHQARILSDASGRLLWRGGRRSAKSRGALLAAVDGYGPRDPVTGRPRHRGLLQGGRILWLAPDYPQSRAIWREEVLPRFRGLPGVVVSAEERRVSVQGLGSIEVRSAEAVDSIRGGSYDGAVVDEAAHLDLEHVLEAILLPTLVDRNGWLWLISTTNGAWDGNEDRRTPSFFNLLCAEQARGLRPGWAQYHTRLEDNPLLSPDACREIRAAYPAGSLRAQEELDAELVAGGGRFYPELSGPGGWSHLLTTVSRVGQRWDVPDWATFWGSYDWGFAHPAAYLQWCRVGNEITLLDSVQMHRYQDDEQGALIRGTSDPRCLGNVYAGHDAFATRQAHSAAAETVADVLGRYSVALVRAAIDRAAGAKAVRRVLTAEGAEGAGVEAARDVLRALGVEAGRPAVTLRVNDTPGNREVLEQLSLLIPDRLNFDVPAKRDANERGEGGDDGADAFRYGLASPGVEALPPIERVERSNVSDGRDDLGADPFAPEVERGTLGWAVEYVEREGGAGGQFSF